MIFYGFFTAKRSKNKGKVSDIDEKLCRTDPYSLCLLLSELGFTLTPKYRFVFVDEAQDISPSEYAVLRK